MRRVVQLNYKQEAIKMPPKPIRRPSLATHSPQPREKSQRGNLKTSVECREGQRGSKAKTKANEGPQAVYDTRVRRSISVKRAERAVSRQGQRVSPQRQEDDGRSHSHRQSLEEYKQQLKQRQQNGALRPKKNLSLNHHSLNMHYRLTSEEDSRQWRPPKAIKRMPHRPSPTNQQHFSPEHSLTQEDRPPTPREATERSIVLNAESLLKMNRVQQEQEYMRRNQERVNHFQEKALYQQAMKQIFAITKAEMATTPTVPRAPTQLTIQKIKMPNREQHWAQQVSPIAEPHSRSKHTQSFDSGKGVPGHRVAPQSPRKGRPVLPRSKTDSGAGSKSERVQKKVWEKMLEEPLMPWEAEAVVSRMLT